MCRFFLSRDGLTCRADQSAQDGGNSTKVGKKIRDAGPERCSASPPRLPGIPSPAHAASRASSRPPALAPPTPRSGPAPGGAHTWPGGDFHVWATAARWAGHRVVPPPGQGQSPWSVLCPPFTQELPGAPQGGGAMHSPDSIARTRFPVVCRLPGLLGGAWRERGAEGRAVA